MPSTRTSSTSSKKTSTEEICSICMDPLASKRSVSLRPCNHRFHRTCIASWFEAGKSMMPADFTCCLCRTKCDKATDDKNDIVPRFFPFEKKEGIETFIRMLPKYEDHLVKTECEINNAIVALNKEKKLAIRKKKSKEFIADFDEEIAKLKDRTNAVTDIFVNLAVEKNAEYIGLDEDKYRLENELEKIETIEAENVKIKEEMAPITKKMNVIEEEARGRFKELCSKMAAKSTPSPTAAPTSKNAAPAATPKVATSSVPTDRVTAKRRFSSEVAPRVLPKRRRN